MRTIYGPGELAGSHGAGDGIAGQRSPPDSTSGSSPQSVIDLGDERLRRGVRGLHRAGPRAVYELLVELGASRLQRTIIETTVARYAAALAPRDMAGLGADVLPSPMVELLDAARRDLGDAAAAGLTDEAAWHVDRARAGLDEMLAAIEGDGP
ncbi:MAG TPA: hypothetical protein VFQ90_00415 [Stellaceae bacterium]|jgi:hypothetical protein|nr:hypothetical protein [Stellaceae bacterium]